jgi:hypothetical protein
MDKGMEERERELCANAEAPRERGNYRERKRERARET